ncbi:MAG: ribokinase [Pirellulaceae bacterium]|nr:ribokinase [Pirellulaceae bacterium]
MNSHPHICVVGSSMHDQITRAARLPNAGETLVGSSYVTGFGGKGSNQAVMAARLGAQVTMVVKLGNDAIGKETAQHYAEEKIHTEFVFFDDQRSSGVAPIWVDENTGQNRILVVPGANQALTADEVRLATAALQSAHVVVCQMEIPMECNLEAFRKAKEVPSVLTILNPAPSGPVPDEILRLTDLLAPNESEAAALTGFPVSNLTEAERAARALQARGARTVLITLGANGALAVTADDEVIHVAAPVVKAVDTTGAGDCFIGCLAYFMAAGFGLRIAMEKACVIASHSVTAPGTQSSFPRRIELDPMLFA